jgi:ATP-dependent Clp protease ATP-binding subunit ClpA
MNDYTKISYYDLKLEARAKRLPEVFGFEAEIARLNRIVTRSIQHNAVITAPSGCGKSALLMAWAESAKSNPAFFSKKIVLLNSSSLQKIGQLTQNSLNTYQEAFSSLENCVLIIDSFGEMIYQSVGSLQNWNTLLKPLFSKDGVNVILSMQPEELGWLMENKSHFLSHFETLKLEVQSPENQLEILKRALVKFGPQTKIEEGVLENILKLCARFPSLGQLPKSAIQLMDEALAEIKTKPTNSILDKTLIEKLVAEKTGVPLSRLSGDEKELLKNLPELLNTKIVGQAPAIGKMVSVIQRARLGLRNQNRPLASFLVLGPSGVGKTETAKILAENLYGSTKHFLRIDMSEFGESHAAARLLGSPAGYVGFESGGQLTNHFQNNPYSLLLLDEIEKANQKIFDIFLQILDDGRVTSAKGEVVDLTQSIIMATSNLAVEEILIGSDEGQDLHHPDFVKSRIIPKLLASFRMEFLNRFDSILIYKPLSINDLTDIALLEIKKIEDRTKSHNIKFNVTKEALLGKISELHDPRFGARPVKRFVEEACENLITEKLLNQVI